MSLRDSIKRLRDETRITQAEFAALLHVSVVSVSRWENGKAIPGNSAVAAIIKYARSQGVSDACMKALLSLKPGAHELDDNQLPADSPAPALSVIRQFADRMPVGIGVYDIYDDGRVEARYANEELHKLIGQIPRMRARFAGFYVLNAVNEDDRAKLVSECLSAIEHHRQINADIRVASAGDREKWINVRGKVIGAGEGMHTVYCAFTDIDDMKSLQRDTEARYAREVQLRREMNRGAEIYIQINITTGMVEELSGRCVAVPYKLPFPATQTALMRILGCETDADRDAIGSLLDMDNLPERCEKGETTGFADYRRAAGGAASWMRLNCGAVKRPGTGEMICFVSVTDIDAQKKQSQALSSIVREEMESVILLNVHTRRIILVQENRTFPGYPAGSCFTLDPAFRRQVMKDVWPEDAERCDEFIKTENIVRNLRGVTALSCVYRVRGADGSPLRKEVRAFYLDENRDEIVFVRRDVTTLYDETQRQKKVLTEAMEKANEANRAKSSFISHVSHDMRTPLNAIISLTSKELTQDATCEGLADTIEKVHTSGRYLLGIINDVLDISKIENDRLTLKPEAYSTGEFISAMDTIIGEQCREKGITYLTDVESAPGGALMVDKVHFNQIFVNLLSNAVKFTPAGGQVELRGRNVSYNNGMLTKRFTVRDNGIGMSPDFLPTAFDSFTREERSGEKPIQGTGLGLSIVKQLVELMGGKVSVTSAPDHGTEFTVEITAACASAVPDAAAAVSKPPDLSGVNVLLCEDHPLNAEIAMRLLKRTGCSVDHASDGAQAVRMFSDSPEGYYSVVLMDLGLPVMNGLDATRAIRALDRPDGKTAAIIAMTGNAFEDDAQASFAAGMNGHLVKPVEPSLLYRTVAEAARRILNK